MMDGGYFGDLETLLIKLAENEPWLFATLVILLMAMEGLALGVLFDYIIRTLGIDMPEGGGH